MRCVRVWFHKTGPIRYISHLDLMRTMTRAIRRSGIDLWYTEGFNPHPYMTFALPLSLGMQSVCESMDIRIEGDATNEEICRALQSVMPEGIFVTAVKEPVLDPKFIAFARFSVAFKNAADPALLRQKTACRLRQQRQSVAAVRRDFKARPRRLLCHHAAATADEGYGSFCVKRRLL